MPNTPEPSYWLMMSSFNEQPTHSSTSKFQRYDITGIIKYDECIVYHALNLNLFGIGQTSPRVLMWNAQNTSSRKEPDWDSRYDIRARGKINASYAEICLARERDLGNN